MNKLPLIAIVMLIAAVSAFAQTAPQTAPDAAELTRLLNEFLAGASRNDAAIHERFWADDLIYTRSAGRRVTKADILRDLHNAPAPKPGDPATIYTAEDIRIQQYGDTAIVAFRLVATTDHDGTKSVANLLNSGTFVKRNGKWQVVNWQSTRMPQTEAESRKEVTTAVEKFHLSLVSPDVPKLTSVADPKFIWTRHDGQSIALKRLADDLVSGQIKFANPNSTTWLISLHGDTAVVRGEIEAQKMVYTLTFVNQIGGWKAVAMHSSNRPSQ